MPTLYRRGRVHAPQEPPVTAMLVDGETVAWLGDEDAAQQYAGDPGVHVVDLDGAFLLPAFVDAHVHTTDTGLALTGLDLRAATSLREALDAIEHAARAGRGRPLLGGGWDETEWPEGRPPTAAELDRASYGGVVYLARVDMHSAIASSALLAAVPAVDAAASAGWVREPQHDLLRPAALEALTTGQRADAQRAALRAAAAHGIACVHEMAGPVISGEIDLQALLALSRAEPLPEVIGYWGELGAVQAARELGAVGAAGDLFCDGSLGSHTAALREPYTDRPDTSGLLRHDTAELAAHIAACLDAGLQTGFHAIGDAAVEQLLDAFELATERAGRLAGAGQRVEHAECVPDLVRLAASGLIASMQPCFDALWGGADGMYVQRLGSERALATNLCGDLAAAGVPLAFGSDSPVTELGPWAAVEAAVHPRGIGSPMDVAAAFDAHSAGGWVAAGRPGEGVLAVGAPATFAIWQAAAGPGTGLPDIRPGAAAPQCLATVRRGTPIHDAGAFDLAQ